MQYVNHACHPNCALEIWRDHRGWLRAILVAQAPIYHLHELTFHYQWTAPSIEQCTPCHCGLKLSHVIERITSNANAKVIQGSTPSLPGNQKEQTSHFSLPTLPQSSTQVGEPAALSLSQVLREERDSK